MLRRTLGINATNKKLKQTDIRFLNGKSDIERQEEFKRSICLVGIEFPKLKYRIRIYNTSRNLALCIYLCCSALDNDRFIIIHGIFFENHSLQNQTTNINDCLSTCQLDIDQITNEKRVKIYIACYESHARTNIIQFQFTKYFKRLLIYIATLYVLNDYIKYKIEVSGSYFE